MPGNSANMLGGRLAAAVLFAGVLAFGLVAVLWGPTTNWDLRNYHLYDAWAFLNVRIDTDIAPAQLQTYFNPLLQVPFYLTATRWQIEAHLFLLGTLQGLNGVLLYLLARRVLPQSLQGDGPGMALAAAFTGVTSATVLGQLGTTIGDNLVSIAALAALALALERDGPSWRRAGGAGLLLGAGTALKLTLAPIALGIVLAIVLATPGRRRRRVLVALGTGAATGFLLLGGWWMWALWQRFGNPVYPQFAALFHGPLDPPFPVRDLRFVPDPPWRAFAWPFAPAYDWRTLSEIKFRDLRVPALALGTLLLPWWRRRQHTGESVRGLGNALLCGLALAYAGWLTLFGYHRYLAAVEMLAPLALLLLIERAMARSQRLRATAATILAALVLTTNPPNWGNAPQGSGPLELTLPAVVPVRGAMVLLAGDAPSSYLAPAWPESARFVRVQSNFHGETWPPYAFDRRLAQAIDTHAGPLVVVHARGQESLADAGLARMGVARDRSHCGTVRTPLAPPDEPPLQLCAATRTEPATVALERSFARWRADCARNGAPDALWRSVCAAVGG